MRRSTNNVKFIEVDGAIVGVCLGSDFCSEHETGVSGMLRLMEVEGTEGTTRGLARWVIKKPQNIAWVGFRDDKHLGAGMLLTRWPMAGRVVEPIEAQSADCKPFLDYNTGDIRADHQISAAWDRDSFAVIGWTDEAMCKLSELYEAFHRNHGVFLMTNSVGIGNAGPTLFRVDLHPELWQEEDRKQKKEQAEYEEFVAKWEVESAGLYRELLEMEQAVASCLKEGPNRRYNFPAYSLPVKREDGSWTNRPRFYKTSQEELQVWLNPTRQSLWDAHWVSAQDIKSWTVGEGKIWPLGAVMPDAEHPFWVEVKKLLPEPDDNKQWSDTFPWSVSGVYHSGDYLWKYISDRLGFVPEGSDESYKHRFVGHALFQVDIREAAEKGLTTVCSVKDAEKLNTTVAAWNASCPAEDRFAPHLFGRGQALVQRLRDAKTRIKGEYNMES